MTDPHTTNPAPHEAAGASPGHVSVVIVGAGFAGLGTAIRLLQSARDSRASAQPSGCCRRATATC
ncbi:hypothetical protein [Streptomyces sp. NPDC088246]|uniref:hypothetical protein n=1 Tax=Streptomyces sp. NPDC088246 TaxID=3365842 RepID=UPI0037F407C5